ncbi:MAG TPA: DinB family protein [Pyrinomonadaceae bacterium]|nr:DinB family protein [Pyrinomonadaceae bacterium]
MTTKEILLEQFTACYDENGWFVALKNAVENVSAEQAIWKPENSDNSIWEILSHLNFYNEAYLKRFQGIDYVYPTSDNRETFSSAENVSDEAWRAEVERFDAIMSEWRNLLASADESKFKQEVSATNKSLWGSIIAHINVHNAHHAGQIVLLRKLQGAWDNSKGVS